MAALSLDTLLKLQTMPEGPEKEAYKLLLAQEMTVDAPESAVPVNRYVQGANNLASAAQSGSAAVAAAQDNNYVGAGLNGAVAGAGAGMALGAMTGIGAGVATGAAAGSVVPGIGTLIGAGVGLAGGLIGAALSKKKEAPKDPLEEERKRLANEYQQKVNTEMTRKMNRQTNIRNLLLYR